MKHAPVRHRLEYGLLLAAKGIARALPHLAARRLGEALGGAAAVLDRHHRRVAEENLAAAFPAWRSDEVARAARACYRHFGGALFDALSVARFDRGELCRRVESSGWEHLEAAAAGGRGVLVMGAHLGSWEVVALAIGALRAPLASVGRAADNPFVDRELQRLRTRFDNVSLDKHGAVRRMLRTLAQGGQVGLLIDQRVRPADGIAVPFFGRPAWTSPLLARLALRTGAPIVPAFGDHRPGGRYRVWFEPPIAASGAESDAAVAELTRRCLAEVEAAVRRAPAQWLWLHERWKGAPA